MNNDLSSKEARHAIFIVLIGIAVLITVIFIAIDFRMAGGSKLVRYVGLLIVSLLFIDYWYKKSEKYFSDPYSENENEIENNNLSQGDDIRGYKMFSLKVIIVFCIIMKIYAEIFI